MTLWGRLIAGLLCPGFLTALVAGLLCRGFAGWLGAKMARRPAYPPWWPAQEIWHLAGKSLGEGPGRSALLGWTAVVGLVALSWATGMLPWPRWPWALTELPGDLVFYLLLLAVPPLVRLVAAGVSARPMAALGVRRLAPPELARLLPVMLAGAALPLFTQQISLSQQVALTIPGALVSVGTAGVLLATLPWPLWDRGEHDGPLAGLGGRVLAVLRAVEALELAAQAGLIAVALRAGGLLAPDQEGLLPAVALVAVVLVLTVWEWRGRRRLLPEAARWYTRWALPAAALVVALAWWFG